jgi:ABC-type nickel/cobalt efflux system permease component RcnA
MRRFKSFLLILIALWLPLQTAAAAVMPFCRHAAERQLVQHTEAASPAHCHEHAAALPEGPAGDSLSCDNCEMCHLASAGYLPAVTAAALPPLTANILVATQLIASPSHIPEPPQHPPRRTS